MRIVAAVASLMFVVLPAIAQTTVVPGSASFVVESEGVTSPIVGPRVSCVRSDGTLHVWVENPSLLLDLFVRQDVHSGSNLDVVEGESANESSAGAKVAAPSVWVGESGTVHVDRNDAAIGGSIDLSVDIAGIADGWTWTLSGQVHCPTPAMDPDTDGDPRDPAPSGYGGCGQQPVLE